MMTASMSSAVIGPLATRATSTATVPATVAPTSGTNAPRKTSTPIASTNGTPRIAAPTAMPMASVSGDDHGRPHELGQRDPGDPARAVRRGRGRRAATSRTIQDQIRSPSARKKYVEKSTMKKPAKHVADRRADLGDPADDLAVLGLLGDGVLGAVDVVVDLRVAGVQRAVLEPVLDLVEPGDRLVGQVGGAGGDLLAGQGEQQPDERDAGDHDPERGQTARQPDPHQPVDDRDRPAR